MKSYTVLVLPNEQPLLQQFVTWEQDCPDADEASAKARLDERGLIILYIQADTAEHAYGMAITMVQLVRESVAEQEMIEARESVRRHASLLDRMLNWIRGGCRCFFWTT